MSSGLSYVKIQKQGGAETVAPKRPGSPRGRKRFSIRAVGVKLCLMMRLSRRDSGQERFMSRQDDVVFLKGGKVYLRPVRSEDLSIFLRWTNDPEMRWLYLKRPFPIDEIEGSKWVMELHKRTDTVILVICLKSGRAIGMIGLYHIDWKNRVGTTENVIGEKQFWGKGYGSEAKMLILNYAFNTLNLRKVCATVYGFNKRSQAYNKKCGYQVEGVQRQHIFMNGEYHDRILMAVFRDEWQPIWNRFLKTGKV
jgi:RimJ/RimL family protein N-acetyltransferase